LQHYAHSAIREVKRDGHPDRQQQPAYANERHISLFAASTEFGLSQKLSEKAMHRLGKFRDWVIDTADRIERGDTFAVIEQFIDQIGYSQYLQEESKTKESADRKIKNVYELIEWLKRIADKETNGQKIALVKCTEAEVTDGKLIIALLPEDDSPTISGIEILPSKKGVGPAPKLVVPIFQGVTDDQRNALGTESLQARSDALDALDDFFVGQQTHFARRLPLQHADQVGVGHRGKGMMLHARLVEQPAVDE
jgi:hypothetical protein